MSDARAADYRGAGFAGRVGFGRRGALLVIDMVMSYFDRASPMYAGVESIIPSNQRLIAAAHAKGLPVIFTHQYYEDATDDSVYVRKVPALKLLRRGSPWAELNPALPVQLGVTMVKHFPSAFHRTDLAERLRAESVDTLILTGLTTSGCVRATAMDTLINDFAGVVVREAVGDRNPVIHAANLFDIEGKLADVCGEADVLAWIDSRAQLP